MKISINGSVEALPDKVLSHVIVVIPNQPTPWSFSATVCARRNRPEARLSSPE